MHVDLGLSLFLGLAFLILAVPRVAPGLLFGDPGEFQFAAWRLGLAHPTGYPLYLLLGWLWQHSLAPLGVDPAHALNLLSAVLAGAAVALTGWLLAEAAFPSRPQLRPWLGGAALLALNPTFIAQSLVAEVYTLHVLLLTATLMATLRAADVRAPTQGSPAFPLFLLGLTLGHHRTGIFLAPGVLALLLWRRRDWWRGSHWALALAALALPQLLYLYIPLRSGPEASPWLYQRLDGEVLRLYAGGWRGFWEFVSGQGFAGSFLSPAQAWARLGMAAELWRTNLGWPGLLWAAWGLVYLARQRRVDWLLLTLPFALLLQVFNLFYGIGDIHVFYIPLYLVAALWAGWGLSHAASLILARLLWVGPLLVGLILGLTMVALLPLPSPVDGQAARAMWARILAAAPEDAILVTNDRDEMVPLYYLQAVEGRAPGITGLFPLITAEPRFADVGAVIETALDAGEGRPVYLIKAMPGLEVAFELAEGREPLVQVLGAISRPAQVPVLSVTYGPLDLVGLELTPREDGWRVALYWRVREAMAADYTVSVQLFDPAGDKLAQDDRPPGGVYYPTSLWKPGQLIRDVRDLAPMQAGEPAQVQVVFYTQDETGIHPMREPLVVEVAQVLGAGAE